MACTSRHNAWPREWIETLHHGRELVDGRPRKTYRQIADELGTTPTRVGKAAQRYGATIRDGKYRCNQQFKDSEFEVIDSVLEYGLTMRLMCAPELKELLASKGFKVSVKFVQNRIKRLSDELQRQYKSNSDRKRVANANLATRRRVARLKAGGKRGEDTRSKSKGQDKSDTQEVRLLLRSTRHAGHGAERHP